MGPAPGDQIGRRAFLAGAVVTAAASRLPAQSGTAPIPIIKLSAVIHRVNGQLSTTLSPAYRDRLDHLMDVFGEDRVVFGSDWPNSDGVAPLDQVVAVVKDYFSSRPRAVAEKYFWRNSVKAYKWLKRDPSQPDSGATFGDGRPVELQDRRPRCPDLPHPL